MKRFIFPISLVSAILLSLFFVLPAPAQQVTPPQYFPETNHTVRAPFVDTFVRNGGAAQYGFPITDDYVDPATGMLVQYFEKARLEWHPGNPDPYKVQLGLLGDEMGKREPPIPISKMPAPNDPNCLMFLETGHSTCQVFRDFWVANGGLDRFGYPIAEWTIDPATGKLIQYFQRARLEWDGSRIEVAPLGQIYYRWAKLDPSRILNGARSATLSTSPTTIQARGSVFLPSPAAGDTQVAFVNVTNQLGQPLGGAAVTLVVHYPDHDDVYQMPATTAGGTSFTTFVVPPVAAGTIVSMQFIVTHSGIFGDTRTSFMIWY